MPSKISLIHVLYFLLSLLFLFLIDVSLINKNANSEDNEIAIEIENPIFTTKGVNENPYTIKAASGVQKGDVLELYEIEGKIKNNSEIWIYLNAKKADYNQLSGVIILFDSIKVYTDNHDVLVSDKAIIDIKNDVITLLSNVEYKNQKSRIRADKSIIKNSFQNFEYFGNVNTKLKNY